MKKLFILIVFWSFITHAQFTNLEKFPYSTQSNQSKTEILDLGNNHLIYFAGEESLFVFHSYDNGENWSYPVPISTNGRVTNLDVKKLPSNRIVVLITTNSTQITHSDDNGETWSELVDFFSTNSEIKMYYSNQLYVTTSAGKNLYYWEATDGTSWGDYVTVPNITSNTITSFTFLKFEEGNFIAAFNQSRGDSSVIEVKQASSLDGAWNSLGNAIVVYEDENLYDIEGLTDDNGKIWLAYTKSELIEEEYIKNVWFTTSEDEGNSWSEPEQYAKSYGDDWVGRISKSSDNPILTILSNRNGVNATPYHGKLGISEDVNVPPYLKPKFWEVSLDYPNGGNYFAKVKSFSSNSINKVEVIADGIVIGELYDDGNHNDNLTNDSIYANTLYVEYQNEIVEINAKSTGILGNEISTFISQIFKHQDQNIPIQHILRNGKIAFPMNNIGIYGDVSETYGVLCDDRSTVYSGGFTMSGYSNNELWANAMASASRIKDYIPGKVGGEDPGKLFVVKATDFPFGESWQDWSEAVELGAFYHDGNWDGIYNPVDLNSNGILDENEDSPDILGDETVWCVYNDGVPAEQRNFSDCEPQGIEIRQTFWTSYEQEYKNVVFMRYSITNTGLVADTLKDVYFGFWQDNDIGDYVDDLVGSKSDLKTCYTYNDGDDSNFLQTPPAVFTTILQDGNPNNQEIEVASLIHYMSSHPTQGDPDNMQQLRNYHLGMNQAGEYIDPCNWAFGEVVGMDCSSLDPKFMYDGNPSIPFGWINTFPTDQRQQLSTGPFDLVVNKPINIIGAFHISRGESNLESVSLGLEKAEYLLNNPFPIVAVENNNEIVKEFKLYQNYPNPFSAKSASGGNPTTTIKFAIPNVFARSETTKQSDEIATQPSVARNDNVRLVVYNSLGQQVAELINKPLTAGNYEVEFRGANLPSGIYFYRLQSGSFAETKKMILIK